MAKRKRKAQSDRRGFLKGLFVGAGVVITYGDRILSFAERLAPRHEVPRVVESVGTAAGRATVTATGSVVLTPGTGRLVINPPMNESVQLSESLSVKVSRAKRS